MKTSRVSFVVEVVGGASVRGGHRLCMVVCVEKGRREVSRGHRGSWNGKLISFRLLLLCLIINSPFFRYLKIISRLLINYSRAFYAEAGVL